MAPSGAQVRSASPVRRPRPVPPFAAPAPQEVAALAGAARYLHRAGTVAGTRLLAGETAEGAALLVAWRDQLLAAAALCDGLVELLGERP